MVLAGEDFGFLHKMVLTGEKGCFPLTTKAVVDIDNCELLADYACIFFWSVMACFFCCFFPCVAYLSSLMFSGGCLS